MLAGRSDERRGGGVASCGRAAGGFEEVERRETRRLSPLPRRRSRVAGCLPATRPAAGPRDPGPYRIFLCRGRGRRDRLGLTTWAILRYRAARRPRCHRRRTATRGRDHLDRDPGSDRPGPVRADVLSPSSRSNAVRPNAGRPDRRRRLPLGLASSTTRPRTSPSSARSAPDRSSSCRWASRSSFRLTATDVVHSFYVPAFLYKRDAIPGRENRSTYDRGRPGGTNGASAPSCCGIFHWRMPFTVRPSRAEYDAWLADAARAGQRIRAAPAATP